MPSFFQNLINEAVTAVEAEEKSTVVSTVKDEIATIIQANAPQTEAEAVAIVNTNIVDITNKGIAAIKSPLLVELANLAKPTVTTWVEGIADGAVSEVFAAVQAGVTRLDAGNAAPGTVNIGG